jgi:hypothetical protein
MPKILDRLVRQIQARGEPKSKAYPIAVAALQKQGSVKKGTTELTPKGVKRQALGNDGRAKERASRYSGGRHKPSDYKYSPKTNMATLKKRGAK